MSAQTPWTGPEVAEALVRAFRRMPGHAVMSRGGRVVEVAGGAPDLDFDAFTWPELYVADVRTRRVLMTWARCKATGESMREIYRELPWRRSTAERRRVAALDAIAKGLERAKLAPRA